MSCARLGSQTKTRRRAVFAGGGRSHSLTLSDWVVFEDNTSRGTGNPHISLVDAGSLFTRVCGAAVVSQLARAGNKKARSSHFPAARPSLPPWPTQRPAAVLLFSSSSSESRAGRALARNPRAPFVAVRASVVRARSPRVPVFASLNRSRRRSGGTAGWYLLAVGTNEEVV